MVRCQKSDTKVGQKRDRLLNNNTLSFKLCQSNFRVRVYLVLIVILWEGIQNFVVECKSFDSLAEENQLHLESNY